MEVQAFVEQYLPPRPARVLEIGCGGGDLARALADRGYAVTAIDPHAPAGDIFRSVTLADFADRGPFDALVAIRSLHHIHDLDGAVAKMARLLRPGGRILIREHAWERVDAGTARWYLDHRPDDGHRIPATVEECLHRWSQDHRDLHTATAMRAALGDYFTELHFRWTPYLYAELGPTVAAQDEQALIDAHQIEATGFAFVGER